PIEIADLGAGEGVISQLLARRAQRVWCIDNSPRMVEVGSALARDQGIENLTYKLGDIEDVPLPDASVDLALLSQALHHAAHPTRALAEAYRILRPGGQVVVLDLLEHQFEKARELYADRWLGFTPNHLYGWLREVGFLHVSVDTVAREAQEPYFQTLLAVGSKERAEQADRTAL
ncbi:MAG: class I SAM-dependent methyltransferase, partial [Opitutales bacterium]